MNMYQNIGFTEMGRYRKSHQQMQSCLSCLLPVLYKFCVKVDYRSNSFLLLISEQILLLSERALPQCTPIYFLIHQLWCHAHDKTFCQGIYRWDQVKGEVDSCLFIWLYSLNLNSLGLNQNYLGWFCDLLR